MGTLSIERLMRLKNSKNATKSAIAKYFLNKASEINSLTINSVAVDTNTSYATVCRFIKEMNFSGFREFKKNLHEEFENAKIDDNIFSEDFLEFSPGNEFSEISKRICDFAVDITRNSYLAVTKDIAEKINQFFKKAEHIHFFGLGASSVTAQYAHIKFFRLKNGCSFSNDTVISKMTASLLKKDDVLFLFSSTGRTKAVTEAAKLAKNQGAIVIAISDFINTPLYDIADINICTTVRDVNKFLDSDIPLIQGQITIIDILYKYMLSKTDNNVAENLTKSLSAISIDKQ